METVKVSHEVTEAVTLWKSRANSGPAFWMAIGYEGKNALKILGQGEGDITDAIALASPDKVSYLMCRLEYKVELATTVKFAFVDHTPDTLKPMRRALVSTHKEQVLRALGPFHATLQASDDDDLATANADIMSKLGVNSGTAVHEVTGEKHEAAKAASQAGIIVGVGRRSSVVRTTSQSSKAKQVPGGLVPTANRNDLVFADESAAMAAMAAVRADADATDWALFGYSDDHKSLVVLSTGSGGVAELVAALDDSRIYYALFRVTDTYDSTVNVRFGFLKLMSTSVKPTQRATVSTHRGFVVDKFGPFHVEWSIDDVADFSPEIVADKIGSYSGTKSKVMATTQSGASTMVKGIVTQTTDSSSSSSSASSTGNCVGGRRPSVNLGETAQLLYDDEAAVTSAIAAVRNDGDATDWAACKYVHKHTLSLLGSGAGGFDDMMAALVDDAACFALLRVTDRIDNSVTIKFVYVKYMPDDGVKPMVRGAINTMQGSIDAVFTPSHVQFSIGQQSELTAAMVAAKVGAASGSASHVVARQD